MAKKERIADVIIIVFICFWISYMYCDLYIVNKELEKKADSMYFAFEMAHNDSYIWSFRPGDGILSSIEQATVFLFFPTASIFLCVNMIKRNRLLCQK